MVLGHLLGVPYEILLLTAVTWMNSLGDLVADCPLLAVGTLKWPSPLPLEAHYSVSPATILTLVLDVLDFGTIKTCSSASALRSY